MYRVLCAIALLTTLVQAAASGGWAQVGAAHTELTTDGAACRQAPTRRCVADLAVAAIEEMSSASMRDSILLRLALAQARGGDAMGALATLDHMRGNISNYGQVLEATTEAQVAANDIAPVLRAVEKIEDSFQRAFAYVHVAEKSAPIGGSEASREAFRLALVTASSIPSLASRAFLLTQTADTAVVLGDLDTAREALDLAWAVAKGPVTPDTHARTLASIAMTRAAMGDISRAQVTAETILDSSARAVAFARIGEAQAKSGDRQAARDSFHRALMTVAEIDDASPRTEVLVQISRALVAAEDRTTAEEVLRQALTNTSKIEDRRQRAWSLVWISEVQASMGALEAALVTADMIEDAGADADGAGRMAEMRNADGVVIRTKPASESMRSLGNHDRAVSQVVEAQLKAGNLELALEVAKRMRDRFWRASRLADMGKARAEAADSAGAREIITAAVEAIGQMERDKWQASAIADVAEAQAMVGDVAAAMAAVGTIAEEGYRDHALFRMSVGVARRGDAAAVDGILDPYARAFVLATLGKWRVDGPDRVGGLQAISASLSTAESIDDGRMRAKALHRISEAQVVAGDVEGVRQTIGKVLKLVGMLANAEQQESMSLTIAETQANAGDFSAALATATGITDLDLRARALANIAEVFQQ